MALTKDNALGFRPFDEYPFYEYRSVGSADESGSVTGRLDGSRIDPTPEGYAEYIRYADIDQHFADYCNSIREEHADLSDEQLAQPAPFSGRWRSQRWVDARHQRQP